LCSGAPQDSRSICPRVRGSSGARGGHAGSARWHRGRGRSGDREGGVVCGVTVTRPEGTAVQVRLDKDFHERRPAGRSLPRQRQRRRMTALSTGKFDDGAQWFGGVDRFPVRTTTTDTTTAPRACSSRTKHVPSRADSGRAHRKPMGRAVGDRSERCRRWRPGWWRVGRHGVNRAGVRLTAAPLCSSPARRGVVEPLHGRLMGCATFVASMRHRSIDRR
jgi:hypothetical protein